ADVAYYGVSFGIKANEAGVVQNYKPTNFDAIPDGLKDPNGAWFAIHSGTIGLFVNVDALDGAPVPQSWNDLLKPEYKGMVGYLDPSSAFVGYAGAVAINRAMGGSLDDFTPGIEFFKKLKENDPIVPKQTAYARVLSGEIPILLDYDFNAYRAKYKDSANVEFVIPSEGTVTVPYVMSLVANNPHGENGKKVLDYVMSEKGQSHWANAFLRPVIPSAMSPEAASKFLPEADYARSQPVDYAKMATVQTGFSDRYLAEVR
ncbi:MAG: extracellular solute-binding protein, partial [Thalassospira sp.]